MKATLAGLLVIVFISLSPPLCGAEGPEISIGVNEYDFGSIQYGQKKEKGFKISNAGDKPLQITKARASCGCTTVKVEDLFLLPKESTNMIVGFDTKGLNPGKKTKTVYIHSNDPKKPIHRIRVYAEVIRRISVAPKVLVARLDGFREKVTLPMEVENRSDQEITLKTSKIRGMIKNAVLAPKLVSVGPGQKKEFQMELTLEEKERQKYYRGDVLLETNYPSEERIMVSSFITVKDP